jgi:hypothetical protein
MNEPAKKEPPRKEGVALATIGVVGSTDQITVHFNPVSLQFTVNNQLKENGGTQYVTTATTKLTMDLIFDSTDTGSDVTEITRKIQAFLGPPPPPGEAPEKQPTPPKVQFEWGTMTFKGYAEGYKETLDFFSIDGVPLRASVNLTLTSADRVFAETSKSPAKDSNLVDAPPQSAADVSKNADAPGAARAIARANNQESLRFGSGTGLTVGGSVELKPAVAFSAGGGAGVSLGGGSGISLGGSASAGLGVSGNASLGVSGSAGISGLARLSATEGAFSGLRTSVSAPSAARFDPARLVPKISSSTSAIDAGATFQVGGKAIMEGSGGLRADVGASGKLSFDSN